MENSRPDIVIYLRSLYNGGTDQVMVNLAREFLSRGLAVTMAVDLENPWSPYRDMLPAGLRYVVLDAKRPLARLLKLRRFLVAEQPRSLISAGFFPNIFAILARALSGVTMRLVATEHNSPSMNRRLEPLWSPRRWFLLFVRLLYPKADAVVAVSKGTAGDLRRAARLDDAKVRCIYNPVVSEALFAQSQHPVDDPWFAASDLPVVIALGRLEPQKNFAMLIRAFQRVHSEIPCRLAIFGDGSEQAMLESLIADLGLSDCVQLRHFVPNPHAYTARASLLVLSSIWEGLSNVLIEAVALGTPVVATDCPFGPAEVLDGGRCGTLVPVGDVDRLAEAMIAALRDPPPPVPAAWLDQFTASRSADRYLELLAPAEAA